MVQKIKFFYYCIVKCFSFELLYVVASCKIPEQHALELSAGCLFQYNIFKQGTTCLANSLNVELTCILSFSVNQFWRSNKSSIQIGLYQYIQMFLWKSNIRIKKNTYTIFWRALKARGQSELSSLLSSLNLSEEELGDLKKPNVLTNPK